MEKLNYECHLVQGLVRFKTRPGAEWEAGLMTMRDDYQAQRYDILPLKEGRWPGDKEIGIERQSQSYFNIRLGDQLIFKMEGVDRVFMVSGKLRHPFILPPAYEGPAYFFTDAAGMEHFGLPVGQEMYTPLILAGQPIARRLGQIMLSIDLEYSYDLNAVLFWLILIAGLASLVPARYATQISVRKSLAYGG